MSSFHPFQITALCNAPSFAPEGLLLAACGSQIISVKLADGSIVSQWSEQKTSDSKEPTPDGPPGKKRKLEPEAAVSPVVIKLTVAPDQQHVVAVTEDKGVRVLSIDENGALVELSQRVMPKRPCAVLVTPDNQSILCGDKFGDVYSLPMKPSTRVEEDEEPLKPEVMETSGPKKYVPSATTLTVHSGRNRRALENQLKQKDLKAKSREGPKFEHQLLLGHVSMLTDVKFATDIVNGKTRGYIITADRDEHIRISRGPPQAHVIEQFCLGHREFISKVCLLPESNTLVSGGGDDWLGIWDWKAGSLQQKRDMRSAVTSLFSAQQKDTDFGKNSHIAVSGIWAAPATPSDAEQRESELAVLVACERLPCLLASPQGSKSSDLPSMTGLRLSGNPLDVTVVGNSIVVSLDVVDAASPRLQAYRLYVNGQQVTPEVDGELDAKLEAANRLAISAPERKELDNLLYGIENLRKRGSATDEDQDGA